MILIFQECSELRYTYQDMMSENIGCFGHPSLCPKVSPSCSLLCDGGQTQTLSQVSGQKSQVSEILAFKNRVIVCYLV